MKFWVFQAIAASVAIASVVNADEPCEEFLGALIECGYYDVALEYIDEMESSPLAPQPFLESLPFEKAQILIQSSGNVKDLSLLEKKLSEAEQLLTKSEAAASNSELKARAQDYLGDLQFRRARIYLNLASGARLTANEKTSHFTQARNFLEKALAAFGRAKESYKTILDNYDLNVRDPESKRKLKQLRATYTVVRVKLPQILEMTADTLDANDPERQEYLGTAVSNFEQLWLKYPNFPAGLDSCLYAARCNYKLNKYSEALSFLQQIFNLPNNSALLKLKRRAMVLAADCWAKSSPYPFDEIIANFEPYCSRLTRRDQRESDWQRIRLELAQAYQAKAEYLKNSDPSDGRIKNFNRDAAKLIKSLARSPGEHRVLARQLLSKWNLDLEQEPESESKPIENFADAKQRGIELIGEIEGLNADMSDLRRQLNTAQKTSNEQLNSELNDLAKRLDRRARLCLDTFERALSLADSSVTREDINQIRYLQSVCYFFQENYFESALIGEFLVDRYPTIAFSKQAGNIAVLSYAALHDQAEKKNRTFERERLAYLANKVIDRWPGSNEAATAASKLSKLLLSQANLDDGDIKKVMELIGSVPETSIERAVMNLKLGTQLWSGYQKRKATNEDIGELETRLATAIEYLTDGVRQFNSGNVRLEAAWGSLFLVRALLESGNVKAAIRQLESEPVAPIDLIKQKNPVVFESGKADLFVSETYKTAGKTYLAAISEFPDDSSSWTDKALGVVRALNMRAKRSSDEKAKQDVVSMHRLFAAQLESQLESQENLDEQRQFVASLNRFLETIQTESTDPNTIIWSGTTLMRIGDSFASKDMMEEAKPLYRSAIKALEKAESLEIKDAELLNELKRQKAIAKGLTGKYEESYRDFVDLLRESPDAWHMQMDVAKTLQRWGTSTKTSKPLANALSGAERYQDPKTKRQRNLIWGWSRLADALKSNEKLKNAYYQSLMGAVETRFEYGVIEKNQKVVAAALKRLNIAKTKDQNLGGPVWKTKFDKLEQKIQKYINTN